MGCVHSTSHVSGNSGIVVRACIYRQDIHNQHVRCTRSGGFSRSKTPAHLAHDSLKTEDGYSDDQIVHQYRPEVIPWCHTTQPPPIVRSRNSRPRVCKYIVFMNQFLARNWPKFEAKYTDASALLVPGSSESG